MLLFYPTRFNAWNFNRPELKPNRSKPSERRSVEYASNITSTTVQQPLLKAQSPVKKINSASSQIFVMENFYSAPKVQRPSARRLCKHKSSSKLGSKAGHVPGHLTLIEL